jgi:hypothetical protein
MDEPVVEILFFEGCPNHRPTVELARATLRELGLTVPVREIEVSTDEDARRHRFLGSPSIRVNDEDIEPEARDRSDYAMSCRMYGSSGLPPKELLVCALREGMHRG